MKFKLLEKKSAKELEDVISNYWDNENIFDKTIENREGKENFVFFEGPPTANNLPGIHHVISRNLKDAICKYKTMCGFKVVRKAGWDTHGLPVEIEVEKQLKLNDKTEIEKYGIEKFNKKCKESVWSYKTDWEKMTKEMGYFVDMKNPYVTFDNNFIESEWWILKKFYDEGLIYEGHKILPFCTRCGTGLATHEVAQGYQEDKVTSVTVPVKLVNEDTYFLVWTTTPWTLIANVAVCVNPNEEYVKVLSKGYKFILAKKLCNNVLDSEYEILETFKGTDLEYVEYEQLLPFVKPDKKAFYVICDNYITMSDGTGVVHIAPAYGQDDYDVAKRYNLPVLNPVGEDGKYTEGPWKGTYVIEVDLEIIKYLKENDKLFKKETIVHNYPHCWRCKTPLLYYAKPSWYIKMTALKDKLIKNNKTVNWYPEYVGEKRFGNWLENLNDWALSRNRYWGTPLNIWRCECGHDECIGSRKELVEKAIETIDETIELHRPYVDNVHLKCPICGKEMTRVKEVIDCWFDSGSMPYSQYHYPFENKEMFESQYPADFISEGIDQTRGWFYSLLAISTFLFDKAPYKNVLVNGHLLDKDGLKMSKSRGNRVDPFELFKKYGADTLRWYLVYASPVWTPLKFDEEGLKEVHSKFFNPLNNTYNFFAIYANADNIDPRDYDVKYEDLELIDKWLLSKYNKLVKYVTESFNEYDLNKVVRKITDFVSEDLSNWYIRRNRNRFWSHGLDDSKKAVYKTTYEVLLGLSKLIAPIVPFTSEEMYRNLTSLESVHLSDFPITDNNKINENIEEKMDLVRNLISMGRYVREECKIKVRQPVSEIILDTKNESIIGNLTNLIIEELNVKNITFAKDKNKYMSYSAKANFKLCGSIFGKEVNNFNKYLQTMSQEDIIKLENNEIIKITLDKEYEINKDMVIIDLVPLEGFKSALENNEYIILNTNLTEELILEGYAREFVSKIQNLRKEKDFNIVDRIRLYYNSSDFDKVMDEFKEYISNEILAIEIIKKEDTNNILKINDIEVKVEIEVIK